MTVELSNNNENRTTNNNDQTDVRSQDDIILGKYLSPQNHFFTSLYLLNHALILAQVCYATHVKQGVTFIHQILTFLKKGPMMKIFL